MTALEFLCYFYEGICWCDFGFLCISLQILYNEVGQILKPIILHSGEISKKAEANFKADIGFVQTADGKVNFEVPVRVLEFIDA